MRLYAARWVIPVASPAVENGCVAVTESGEIAYAGPAAAAPDGKAERLGNVVLLPGLINAHSHVELTAFRGAVTETDFFTWIRSVIALKRQHLTDDLARAAAVMGIAEGLRGGVTTYADTSDTDGPVHAMLRMGVRGISYVEVFGPDPAQCGESIAGLRTRTEVLRAIATPLVRVGVSPHAPYTVCDPVYRAAVAFANGEGLPVAVHIAESAAETEYVVRGGGPFAELLRGRGITVGPRAASPIELLRDTGVLEAKPLLIHVIRVGESDLRLIRESGATVVHCPVANSQLGHGLAPLTRFLEEGIPTALGSDSVISGNRMNMIEEARVAAVLQGAKMGKADAVSSRQLVEMLTLGGARVLGLDAFVGSLERGKRADIVAFPIPATGSLPAVDPYELLIHSVRGMDASFVMVDGKELVRDGRLLADVSQEEMMINGDW